MPLFLSTARILRRMLIIFCGVVGFCLLCASVIMVTHCVSYLTSEKIHKINPAEHRPELEGCLVRTHVTQIRSGAECAMENYYNLEVSGAVLVNSNIHGNRQNMPESVKQIPVGTYSAPQILTGVFELFGVEPAAYGGNNWRPADAAKAVLIPGMKQMVKSVTDKHIELKAEDEQGVPYCLCFSYAPSPHKVNIYILARQHGTRLEVQSLLRGEAAFRQATRVRTPIGMSVS